MTQPNLFENTDDEFLEQAEEFIAHLESEIKILEEQEQFFEENNAFNWAKEFPQCSDSEGTWVGFDAIIGNPPYIRHEKIKKFKEYFKENYSVFDGMADILIYFFELGHKILKKDGFLSFIVSGKFTRAEYGKELRKFLITNCAVEFVSDLGGLKVFEKATVDSLIIGWQKALSKNENIKYCKISGNLEANMFQKYILENAVNIPLKNLTEHSFIFENTQIMSIREKIENAGIKLKDWNVNINFGIKTGLSEVFIIDKQTKEQLILKDKNSKKIIVPILRGKDIKKYSANFADLWLINTHNGIKQKQIEPIDVAKNFPAIYEYLLQFKTKIAKRLDQGDNWTNLRNCAYLDSFSKPKIVYQEIASTGNFCWDEEGFFVNQSCYIITGANKYILAVLNSKLISWYFKNVSVILGEKAMRWIKQYVEQIPIPKISEKEQEPFVILADTILNKKKKDENTATEEQKIDYLVYKLYKITEAEIKIIEE